MPIPKWTRVWHCDDPTDLEAVVQGRSGRCSTREFMDEMNEHQPGSGEALRCMERDPVQAIKARWQYLHFGLVLLLLAVAAVWFLRSKVNSANLAVDSVDSVDFYLPNRGHTDSKGEWRADTWDHFQIPDCDSGPPPGSKELVHWVQNVKEWVNDTKGTWVPGMWQADKSPSGGHWVDGHMEYKGHFKWLPKNMSKWVPKKQTAAQLECIRRQDEADGYHKKLIEQHQSFLKAKQDMEWLLRWQGEHNCNEQLVDIMFNAPEEHLEVSGAASGANCQKVCTLNGFDGFSWSRQGGCILKSLGQSVSFQAVHSEGSYSGYACSQQATYLPWITDEAQKHTLYDGMTSTAAPGVTLPQSTFCFMLLQPYSDDVKLVSEQSRLGKGIFSCDHSAVYSSQQLELPSGLKTRKIYSSQMAEKGGQWNVELNTDVTMALFREVLKDPEWRQARWMIFVDPQCVFSAPKLHRLLARQGLVDTLAFLVSPSVGFPSYFQVMSQSALKTLAEKSRACYWQMRYWGDTQYHDSMWLDTCLKQTVNARRVEVSELVGTTKGCHHSHVAAWPMETVDAQRKCYM